MSDLKVSFPSPCSQPWDEMAPGDRHRRCASCDSSVHDLAQLTGSEIQQLLDSGEKVCARAHVDRSGAVKTADNRCLTRRPILACASVALVAACQTAPGGKVENGPTLSGKVPIYGFADGSHITNDNGQSVKLHIGQDGRFDVHGLARGTYSLVIVDYCGASHAFENIEIGDADVDVGELEFEPTCIIVGQMVREDEPGRG